jgi:hypothetical protein
MLVSSTESPAPPPSTPLGLGIALAALGPIALGAVIAGRTGSPVPIAAAPAIVFGVLAATSPALYIAIAATGAAPPLGRVGRALGAAIGAFGLGLAGLVLPAAFLAASAVGAQASVVVAAGALLAAALLGLRRLGAELGVRAGASALVLAVWGLATLGIAGRLWFDLAWEVVP